MSIAQATSTGKTEQITATQFTAAIEKLAEPSFVPPVSLFKLGRLALRKGYAPQPHWPELMRQGWYFEGPRCYAQAGGM